MSAVSRICRAVANRRDAPIGREDAHRGVCRAERQHYPNDVALLHSNLAGREHPLAYGRTECCGKRLVERRALLSGEGGSIIGRGPPYLKRDLRGAVRGAVAVLPSHERPVALQRLVDGQKLARQREPRAGAVGGVGGGGPKRTERNCINC